MPYRTSILQWLFRALITIMGVSGTVLGLLLVFGGDRRFSSPAFQAVRQVPGGRHTWGLLFVLVGIAVSAGIVHGWHPRTLAFSMWALATMYLIWSLAIWVTVGTPTVPMTGGLTYLELAALSLVCGVVARRLPS